MKAPEFPVDAIWLNTEQPLSLKQLKGHVILLDFWTYCCINCIHVLPDLAYLEQKYQHEPFIVIGVHTAKFDNEKHPAHIEQAIARYEIEHPVVVDSTYQIWEEYAVKAWPTFYLIGADGHIIGRGSGEGLRDELDQEIAKALTVAKQQGTVASTKVHIKRPAFPSHSLSYPGKLDFHPITGHLFLTDSNHNRILELELIESGKAKVVNIIGTGQIGYKDGNYDTACFYRPQGIAVTEDTVYICDTENHLIRQIDLHSKQVTTLAGTGKQAPWRAAGGYGPKTALNSPWDVTVVKQKLFIAMAGPHQIWVLDLNTLQLSVFAGSGQENITDGPAHTANLAQPSGICHDEHFLYFVDSEVSALRCCSLESGYVSTYIGTGLFDYGLVDGTFERAKLQHPLGVDIQEHQLYIADTYNHAIRVADLKTRQLSTLIQRKSETMCRIGEEDCNILPLFEPSDVKSRDDKLYITDTNNHLIRVFDLNRSHLETLELIF